MMVRSDSRPESDVPCRLFCEFKTMDNHLASFVLLGIVIELAYLVARTVCNRWARRPGSERATWSNAAESATQATSHSGKRPHALSSKC